MVIEIKSLTEDLLGDYFDFFDNRAFTDHAEWSCCYCTYFHMNSDLEREAEAEVKAAGGGVDALRSVLKSAAKRFIQRGTIGGYLAYAQGVPVGWCNANGKASFSRLDYKPEISDAIRGGDDSRIKAVTCFTIAPEHRGKGIASALLKRVVEDARKDGYAAVEGYPRLHEKHEPFDYYGPIRMYEKAGFDKVAEKGAVVIMRKGLDG